MKRLLMLLLLLLASRFSILNSQFSLLPCRAQGYPIVRNFTQQEYKAHNVNFDLETDLDGTVYVANFEGLLYYDNVEWHIIHTPGITRVTVVQRDEQGNIWVGGYNYFGQVRRKANGELYLQRVGKPDDFRGEIQEIFQKDGVLQFIANDDHIYQVIDGKISVKATVKNTRTVGMADVINATEAEETKEVKVLSDYIQEIDLERGMIAAVSKGNGIIIRDAIGREMYHINKEHGLLSNNVVWISYNGHGTIWGACDDAIFAISLPSAFSRFTASEGLPGSIHAITNFENKKYVGTANGLFRQEGVGFVQVGDIRHACWDLLDSSNGLLAATANGVYQILSSGSITQLTQTSTTAVFEMSDGKYYSAEIDGIYRLPLAGESRSKVFGAEKVNKVLYDSKGAMWMQSIYGEVWRKLPIDHTFRKITKGEADADELATIVPLNNKVEVINAEDQKPFAYPLFSCLDHEGVTWLTNSEGKHLYRWKDGKHLNDMDRLLRPLRETFIHTLFFEDGKVWIGSDNGLWIIDRHQKDPLLNTRPRLRFRSVTMGADSVLWGGFGEMPTSLPAIDSQDRNLRFTYAVDYPLLVGETLYRYRINDGKWSAWTTDNDAEFSRLPYGSYTITVECRLATGETTEPIAISFDISYPFYLRWYMMILYALLAAMLIYVLFRYRLRRLERDKQRLESIVQERTAEVVKQKDEIELKSKSLETALNDLHTAQDKLIRQEKMATLGKLTQGLIDRILNPLNYINNFAKLSEGLVKDVKANVEDEKEHMDEDNYEDTIEVLDMLAGNLKKVGEHGVNTTRILKAMEELLKDRSGGMVETNICAVLKQNKEMVEKYFAKEIAQYHINFHIDLDQENIPIHANPELLSKTFINLIVNSMYALTKKARQTTYEPELRIRVDTKSDIVFINVHDNGIGIEETIIDKVFDPFFTTKTTGEASGIGLYLCNEVVQNYGGVITVNSVKGEYCEFIVSLPILKK
jgi:signal transduction histidine kinase/ligand-binding sensor domain-containing protein